VAVHVPQGWPFFALFAFVAACVFSNFRILWAVDLFDPTFATFTPLKAALHAESKPFISFLDRRIGVPGIAMIIRTVRAGYAGSYTPGVSGDDRQDGRGIISVTGAWRTTMRPSGRFAPQS
jgi:hypothetical protein